MKKPLTAKQARRYAAAVGIMATRLNAMIDHIDLTEDANPEELHDARLSLSNPTGYLWDAQGLLEAHANNMEVKTT